MDEVKTNLLYRINNTADLKKLKPEELVTLSNELRRFIIEIVSNNSGHLGASLGVVELTVALHYVFNMPYDPIVWDVGHQAYVHKILTGRKDVFHTNRKYGGISGFPKMAESEFDSFGVGHSSTSISAALGMAMAAQLKGEKDKQIVAVIGDGSMTGGMAFEGLNNAGASKANLLVILNDNNMAIDPNVGALKEYLLDITTSRTYNKFKTDVWNMLGAIKLKPNPQRVVQKIENGIKSILLRQSNLFESLNFRYFGPIDGHNVTHMVKTLSDLKNIPGPKLLHVLTTKGKGYKYAEEDQTTWHAPGLFNMKTGEIIRYSYDKPQPPKYQDVFGHTLVELADLNEKIVGITPAMASGCSMKFMMDKYPTRTFDVGIAEQHAVTFSAGLATKGLIPFCNIYSSFMQRAYDQVIHDAALQKLQVVLCLDRAGLVGEDGATHHGAYDLAFMRCIPDLTVSAPMNEEELRNLMFTAQADNYGTFVIRYPRGTGVMPDWKKPLKKLPIGKGRMIKDGKDVAILTLGTVGNFAVEACKQLQTELIDAAHFDFRFLKPLDTDLLAKVFQRFSKIITVEDGAISGGFGTAVSEFMCDNGITATIKRLGIPDKFVEHGSLAELYKECGYDTAGIVTAVKLMVGKKILSQTG